MIENVKAWEEELLFTGKIIQDGDNSVSRDEAMRRGGRYLDLVDMLTGDEGPEFYQALIASLQARHDYGAYASTYHALELFPDSLYGEPLLGSLLPLISRQPDWAGRLLAVLCREPGRIVAFNRALSQAPSTTRETILAFIQAQEENGNFLEYYVGKLRPE